MQSVSVEATAAPQPAQYDVAEQTLGQQHIAELKRRAQWFLDQDELELAVAFLDVIEVLDPGDLHVRVVAAQALLALGRSYAAESRLRAVLALDGENVAARNTMARLCLLGMTVSTSHGSSDQTDSSGASSL